MKRLFVCLVLASLVLGMTGIPVAASPTIEKVTFIHHAKPADLSKPVWDDTVEYFKLIAGGVKWLSAIPYEVNPAGSGLDPELVRSTLGASSETWDLETSFELFSSPTITGETSVGDDKTNRIVWGELNPGIIAVMYLWYNPATKQIVEFDMVFNTYYTWSTTGASDAMDLQNIATHEFGHNGLNDLYMRPSIALTMYGYSDYGDIDKRSLGTGDWLGIQELYGP